MYDHVIRLNEISIRPTEILEKKILKRFVFYLSNQQIWDYFFISICILRVCRFAVGLL